MAKISAFLLLLLSSSFAFSADLDGSTLPLLWGIPFAGLLLSIALFPLFAPHFWHAHFGKIALAWGAFIVFPLIFMYGPETASHLVFHTAVLEYIPFMALILALYITSGGIVIQSKLSGTPTSNSVLLLIGTSIASIMGTTGASMLLIRPLLSATSHRSYRAHTIIFFLFLVSNIGGALSPLGDPPLFLGFISGISFFWPLQALWKPTVAIWIILLIIYWLLDQYLYRKEGCPVADHAPSDASFKLIGWHNILLLALVVLAVLLSGILKSDTAWTVYGTTLVMSNVIRDVALIVIALLSFVLTSKKVYDQNNFSWFPMLEVGKLFAAIFLTIIPVILILKAGEQGALAGLIKLVSNPVTHEPIDLAYFWITGTLSSFLDNAPTYLVFFNMASGDPHALMTTLASTLAAISMGAVYMGAMTYIGNAPNFMVRSIAIDSGIKMPSFFGYMLWSCGILLPVFAIVSFVMFY